MLVWLHLSALLLLPAFLIWIFERDQNDDINYHGADVINFQLSMLAYLLPCLNLPGLLQLVALFTVIVVLVNTVRVMTGKPYYYPIQHQNDENPNDLILNTLRWSCDPMI